MDKNKISSLGEFGLIKDLEKYFMCNSKNCLIGLGDDTAEILHNGKLLVTTDTMMERTHFNLGHISFYDLGSKVMAVNISDIASMGGIPLFALITVGLNKNIDIKSIKELCRGIKNSSTKYNINVIGGDTIKSQKDIMVSVTLLGKPCSGRSIKRSGAHVGDKVIVTGSFGNAAYGLKCVKNRNKYNEYFINKLNRPTPRIKEGCILAKNNFANSMMDSSDGLYKTLEEISSKSKVGMKINISNIPIPPKLLKAVGSKLALEFALNGGEDYELVFTSNEKNINKIKSKINNSRIIGEVVKGNKIEFVDNNNKRVKIKGNTYDAFK